MQLIVALAIAIVTVAISYYFVIFLPGEQIAIKKQQEQEQAEKKQKEAQERAAIASKQREAEMDRRQQEIREKVAETEKEMQTAKRELHDLCLQKAREYHTELWNKTCHINGRPSGCVLPNSIALDLEKDYEWFKSQCYTKYPSY